MLRQGFLSCAILSHLELNDMLQISVLFCRSRRRLPSAIKKTDVVVTVLADTPTIASPPIRTASTPLTPVTPFIEAPIDLLTGDFTGREKELDKMSRALRESKARSRYVLYGMPGVGKSQLALRFTQISFERKDYAYVLWISASTIEKLTQGFTSLVDLFQITDLSSPDQNARLTAARQWLEADNRDDESEWLLIFDNVEAAALETLRILLPRNHAQGSILFTPRNDSIALALARIGANGQQISELQPPDTEEAAKLLYRAAGLDIQHSTEPISTEAKELVNTVGRLPLAVGQAASFMKQAHYSIGGLLTLYKGKHRLEVRDSLRQSAEPVVVFC